MAWRVYRKHSLLCETVPLFPGPYPGVRRFRRREPGLRQLGTVAYQGKALAIEGHTNRGVNTNHRMTSHLCDPTRQGPKQGERRDSQYRGVDSTRRGKAPPLAILSPLSHRGERGPSGASLEGRWFLPRKSEKQLFFLRKRRKHTASSFQPVEKPGVWIMCRPGSVIKRAERNGNEWKKLLPP